MEDRPKLRWLKLDWLKLWEEANVRKSGTLVNIQDLALNIKKNGLRAPLLVKEAERDKEYWVFSGQRRLQACDMIKLESVPCLVFEKISLTDAQILSLSENMYREAMNIDDISDATDVLYKKFGDIAKVALSLGVTESKVKSYLDYKAVPDEIKKFVGKGKGTITPKQAKDIYVKFPDIKRAVAVAKELASINSRKKKISFHAAIREATPDDTISELHKKTDKLSHLKKYELLLPDTKSKTIEKIAYAKKITELDLITDIVEQWIDGYERGEHR